MQESKLVSNICEDSKIINVHGNNILIERHVCITAKIDEYVASVSVAKFSIMKSHIILN